MPTEVQETILAFRESAKDLTPQQRKQIIDELLEYISIPLIETFYMLGLETHIESTIVNPPTGDTFSFSFRRNEKVTDGSVAMEAFDLQKALGGQYHVVCRDGSKAETFSFCESKRLCFPVFAQFNGLMRSYTARGFCFTNCTSQYDLFLVPKEADQ